MKIKDLSDYKKQEISALICRIPFIKELQKTDEDQLGLLLSHSCIVELDPQETIMRRGEKGAWLYFLIKGRLAVYIKSQEDSEPLNYITPGELFGDLALLCDYERKATVAADKGEKRALLFATDFNVFGDVLNFEKINIKTKLIFYRTMVHSIRWRLEVSRMESPEHSLTAQLRQVPTFKGDKGSVEELRSLYEQAQYLAALLDRWNSDGGALQDVMVTSSKIQ
ncbi:cyclic nucleotide-binding domain-containing protein [bacterium AH-315-K03]|nr:cyclic nucleotide-binding domain-containing protein [bacterium AH-315-K03]